MSKQGALLGARRRGEGLTEYLVVTSIVLFCAVALLSQSVQEAVGQASVALSRTPLVDAERDSGVGKTRHCPITGKPLPPLEDVPSGPGKRSTAAPILAQDGVGPTPGAQPPIVRVAYNGGGLFQRIGQAIKNSPYSKSGLGILSSFV